MGTWGTEIFGNDESFHWLGLLERKKDYSLIRESFEEINVAKDSYIEIDLASGALAAAEVIAQAYGHPGSSINIVERIAEWLEFDCIESPSPDLLPMARLAVGRVLRPPCEALEGWQSVEDLEEWCQHVRALQARLNMIS